jgi:hypothetical protein
MGASKPAIPEFAINAEPRTLRMERSETHHHRDLAIGDDKETKGQFSDFAYRKIRRFSHTKNKEGVRTYSSVAATSPSSRELAEKDVETVWAGCLQ